MYVLQTLLLLEQKMYSSPSGNRTPVSRVTGGDTDHYTNEDFLHVHVKIWVAEIICPRSFASLRGTRAGGLFLLVMFGLSAVSPCLHPPRWLIPPQNEGLCSRQDGRDQSHGILHPRTNEGMLRSHHDM